MKAKTNNKPKSVTKEEAKKLGCVVFTNRFSCNEVELLNKMFSEISKRNPGSVIVKGRNGYQIWVPKERVKKPIICESYAAYRQGYKTPKQVVGRFH